ncbi:MAG TPA: SGNH/GDSL hydrolase family protein, partial [Halioglobus sp.]
MKSKELLLRFILILTSSLVALMIAEFVYRLFFVGQHQYSVAPTGNQYEFYQFDSTLGWANTPGATGIYQRGEFSYRVSINEHGMRQNKVNPGKTPSTFRIAVLGDSFVWGIGINDEQRLTEQLQGMLPNTEVLNFGTAGYSPVQYLLMMDKVIEFQPDLVVIVFCLGNDFIDNVLAQRYRYYKPYAELDVNGGLVLKGYPIPDVRRFGFKQTQRIFGSLLLAEISNSYRVSNLKQEGLIGISNKLLHTSNRLLTPEQRRVKSKGIRINEAILEKIRDVLDEHGIPLIITSAPTKREYNKHRKYGHEGYYPAAENLLLRSTNKLGIVSISNIYNLDGRDFWVKDEHWNASGHKKMAASLAKLITD